MACGRTHCINSTTHTIDPIASYVGPVSRHWRKLTAFDWLAVIAFWIERHDQRQRLKCLDEHRLKDLGITETEARREAAKPFWR